MLEIVDNHLRKRDINAARIDGKTVIAHRQQIVCTALRECGADHHMTTGR